MELGGISEVSRQTVRLGEAKATRSTEQREGSGRERELRRSEEGAL